MPEHNTYTPQEIRAARLDYLSRFFEDKLGHFYVQRTNQDTKKVDRNGNFFYFQDHSGGKKPEDRTILVFAGKDAKDIKSEALDRLHEVGIGTGKDNVFPKSFVVVLANVPLSVNNQTIVLNTEIAHEKDTTIPAVRSLTEKELNAFDLITRFHKEQYILGVPNRKDSLVLSNGDYFAEFNYICEEIALEVLDYFSQIGISVENREGGNKKEFVVLRFNLSFDYSVIFQHSLVSEFATEISEDSIVEFLLKKHFRLKCASGMHIKISTKAHEGILGEKQKDISSRYHIHPSHVEIFKKYLEYFDIKVIWSHKEVGTFFLPLSENAKKLVSANAKLDIVKAHELLKSQSYIDGLPELQKRKIVAPTKKVIESIKSPVNTMSLAQVDDTNAINPIEKVESIATKVEYESTDIELQKLLRKISRMPFSQKLEIFEFLEAKLKVKPDENDLTERFAKKGFKKLVEGLDAAGVVMIDGTEGKVVISMNDVKIQKGKIEIKINKLKPLTTEQIIKLLQ